MLSDYINQTLVWKTKGSINSYNEATYTTSSAKGRFEYTKNLLRDATGQDVTSLAIFYTASAIGLDDILTHDSRDWRVIQVQSHVDLDGNTSYYEVML